MPQQTASPFPLRLKESPFSHTDHVLDKEIDLEEPCWEMTNAHLHRLENLRALHFRLSCVRPDFCGMESFWVDRIVRHLRFLQDRENFDLSFAVYGKVVPPVTITPRLPFELHLRVLGYIVSNDWKPEDRNRALSTCCLVCRAWCDFCKTKFHTVVLRTRRQLNKLNTSLPSAAYFIGIHVMELSSAGDEHIHYSAPVYLAGKLPFIRHLAIEKNEEGTGPFFVPHDSLLLALRQFKTVTELRLSHITFQLFWHFRRFIVALPALSHLLLSDVDLPYLDPFNQRVPSLYLKPRNLTDIIVRSYLAWNPLWLWILPPHTLPRSTGNPHQRPFLTPSDGGIILKLARLERAWSQRDFNWMYTEEHQQCKSSNSDLGTLHGRS